MAKLELHSPSSFRDSDFDHIYQYDLKSHLPLTSENVEDRAVEHYFFREDQVEIPILAEAFSKVVTFGAGGSGVIISDQGHILTARHVVDNLDRADSKLSARQNGRHHKTIYHRNDKYSNWFFGTAWSRLEIPDPYSKYDIAVVHVSKLAGLTPAPLAKDSPVPGETIFALGQPMNLKNFQNIVLSVGRVFIPKESKVGRTLSSNAEVRMGHSGGAQINARGELVGITLQGGQSTFTTNSEALDIKLIEEILKKMGLPD